MNPEAVGSQSEPVDVSWTSKDALLYAVSIGAGADELAFTTENTRDVDQLVFPTFPVVVGWGRGSALGKIGTYNPALLVHGQQAVTLHRPIPAGGTATLVGRVAAMYDKGKAAVVVTETEATIDGEPLYTNRSSMFIRGEGGWRGDRGPSGPQNVRRSGHPTTRSRTRHRPTRRSSTGSTATATHCTPTRPSPPPAASTTGDGEALFTTSVGDCVVIDQGLLRYSS